MTVIKHLNYILLLLVATILFAYVDASIRAEPKMQKHGKIIATVWR